MNKSKRNAWLYRLRRELRQYTYDAPTFYIAAHDLALYMSIPGDFEAHKAIARSVILVHLGYSSDMARWQAWQERELHRIGAY